MPILIQKNQHRCEREVCLGSQYCAQHLELLGIEVHMKYKYGGSSDVVDYVEKVTVLRDFPKIFDAIGFKLGTEFPDLKNDDQIDIVFNLSEDELNGSNKIQMKIIDLRQSV